VRAGERPLAAVPGWLWAALAASLAAQVALRSLSAPPAAAAADLPPAPRAAALRAASLGEPASAARLAMLYVQAFDLGAGNALPYRRLDYGRLRAWLRAILDTDPRSSYPLFAAARVYAEVDDPARARVMLEFIHEAYLEAPNRRWPALAHAALLAKHRLRDLPLARRYAADLQRLTADPDVPLWAKQMEIFILEDMNELEAARIMLGGMLASGHLRDPGERRFLKERLDELERRLASERQR
jgi:hypothetical protein